VLLLKCATDFRYRPGDQIDDDRTDYQQAAAHAAGYVYVRVPATTGGNACMVPEIGSQLTQAHAWHGWICYHQRALYSSVRAWRAAEADDDLADPACRDVTAHISSYN
jgi:hypothetical protein